MTGIRMFEELGRAECVDLLRWNAIGRVAVVVDDGAPLVVPVNYIVDDETVVFRTGPGSKLAGLRTQPMSFQVDGHDPFRCVGWSVLIRGVAFEIDDDDATVEPVPWAPGDKHHWVRVMPMEMSGRRITWAGEPVDARGYL